MDFSKLSAMFFGVIFIIILYFIIFYALKIMYKDVKGGGRRKPQIRKKNHGLEVLEAPDNSDLKVGTVIPVRSTITLGRNEGNSIVLVDLHASGNHARLLIKNEVLYIEDLNSTNGTFINGEKIKGKIKLFSKDIIKIGMTKFKVLG
jgi:pSer/pThr/pTyr-binding forkhead associated (FHA) protein